MKILVPLDGSVLSEAVLPFACLLARTGGYSLTLLSVWDERETMGWQSLRPEQARTIEKEEMRYLDHYLSCQPICIANNRAYSGSARWLFAV